MLQTREKINAYYVQLFSKKKFHTSSYQINNNDKDNDTKKYFPSDRKFNNTCPFRNLKLSGLKRKMSCMKLVSWRVFSLRSFLFYFPARRFIPLRDRAATARSPVHSIRRRITPFRALPLDGACHRLRT